MDFHGPHDYLIQKYEKIGLWPLRTCSDDDEPIKWWKGVTIPPNMMYKNQCKTCKKDYERFKKHKKSGKRLSTFYYYCSPYCLWFDYVWHYETERPPYKQVPRENK